MTSTLKLDNLSVRLGERLIIDSVSFNLKKGAIGCLLGPSGCGKTTLLRTIAGFEQPVQGKVWLNNQCVSDHKSLIPVEKRQVGMVFQDYALFPHLTVKENVAFGLGHLGRRDLESRIKKVSNLLKITSFLSTYPHRLSGGQQQRVAIARAIAPQPKILLLDEPFSSMDIELREQIAAEIRTVLKQDKMTSVLVTHNQKEAFAMADEIGVIRAGSLLQWDTAFNLYHRPVCTYVADFVGEGVFINGEVVSTTEVETEMGIIQGEISDGYGSGDKVSVLIRPDDIVHDDTSALQALVMDKAFRGADFLYTLELDSGSKILSLIPSHHNHAIGESIGIRLEVDHLVLFPEQNTRGNDF
ncbi:MAG: ABC transporter ATP-binding protein [Gammaproteobacteria bacterium]